MRQLSFLPRKRPDIEYGGDSSRGRRKVQRPFSPKLPLHVSFRSGWASGPRSMLRSAHRYRIRALLDATARRHEVRVYRFANVGNHLHLLIQARSRVGLRAFMREFAGRVAVLVTGAIKGRPEKFWDGLAWSKIVEWGRQFVNASRYILLNVLEGHGLRERQLLTRLEREGIIAIMSPRAGPGRVRR